MPFAAPLNGSVRRRGAAERPWTLPGEARAEVSQLYPRTGCSRWGIALAGRTRHLLYRSPPNSASSPTRLSPPVSDGETRAKGAALAGQASPPPRGLSRAVGRRGTEERTWTLPGAARAEVSQLYQNRGQSVGHSTGRAHQAPAL